MSSRPRILHTITGLGVGGAERSLARLIPAIGGGFDQAVLAYLDGPVADTLRGCGVPVHVVRGSRAPVSIRNGFSAMRLARRFKPDIVQGWMYHGNLMAVLACKTVSRSARCVWNIRHSLHDLSREKPWTRLLIRGSAPLSAFVDATIYNSHVGCEQHIQIGYRRNNAVTFPNGFDFPPYPDKYELRKELRQRLRLSSEALIVGMVSRHHPMKNHRGFVSAMGLVAKTLPDVQALIMGRGADAPGSGLSALAAQEGANVHLLPESSEVARVLGGLDLLCSTSLWGEGFPNILAEGLSLGVPCVATDIGDSKNVVGPGGFVVQPADDNAVAVAILQMLTLTAHERIRIGKAGSQHVRQSFGLGKVADNYSRLYNALLCGTELPATGGLR